MTVREASPKLLERRFAADVVSIVEPSWQEFERRAGAAAVQGFCAFESRYAAMGMGQQSMDSRLQFLDFNPTAESFTPAESGAALDRSHGRLNDFTQDLVQSFCRRKRIAPPDPEDMKATGAIVARVLVRGIEQVYGYINDNYWQSPQEVTRQHVYLPSTLLMLGARLASAHFYEEVEEGVLEPSVSQEVIDAQIDHSLQTACAKIIRNEKHTVPKSKDNEGMRIFAASMNCLRSLYHQGKERSFKTALLNHFYYSFKPNPADFELADGGYDLEVFQDALFLPLAERFNFTLGTDFEHPGNERLHQLLLQTEERADQLLGPDDDGAASSSFVVLMNKMFSTRATRHFVDAIASGEIKYSEIMQAMMLLRQQPLHDYELPDLSETTDAEVEKVWLNWEILPPGLIEGGEHGRPPSPLVKPQSLKERTIDWLRIAKLLQYAEGWGGTVSFARTQIPNLPEDKQYYAVILPEVLPDGTVLEHAIADHPEQGHGLYIWRAERAHLRDPQDKNRNLTWQKVLAHERMIARKLGARCFYHTKNMEINVLDYLTAPPEKLLIHRYAVGRGATRMARLTLRTA